MAVRSSATAEDLPNLSFAGQQDTFLNVIGEGAVLEAVLKCWGSLWTARAIGYRARNNIPHEGLALAVVVQRMVESEASGVLFTANPLTGLRAESAIDAVFGLGEALVSGQVEPDHYVVDHQAGRIVKKALGAKALALHGDRGGGVAPSNRERSQEQALPDAQILELAELGQRVQAEYGFPQDIEWAWADGRFTVLQSRAITSLYPLPEKVPAEPLKVFFSFGAVQGMLDPMTPLGQDAIRMIFAGGARLLWLLRAQPAHAGRYLSRRGAPVGEYDRRHPAPAGAAAGARLYALYRTGHRRAAGFRCGMIPACGQAGAAGSFPRCGVSPVSCCPPPSK